MKYLSRPPRDSFFCKSSSPSLDPFVQKVFISPKQAKVFCQSNRRRQRHEKSWVKSWKSFPAILTVVRSGTQKHLLAELKQKTFCAANRSGKNTLHSELVLRIFFLVGYSCKSDSPARRPEVRFSSFSIGNSLVRFSVLRSGKWEEGGFPFHHLFGSDEGKRGRKKRTKSDDENLRSPTKWQEKYCSKLIFCLKRVCKSLFYNGFPISDRKKIAAKNRLLHFDSTLLGCT